MMIFAHKSVKIHILGNKVKNCQTVAVVDRTRQQKSTLLSLDTDSVTTLAFMATSGGHQGGKRILFLGIVAHMHSLRIFFYRVRS